MKTLDVPEASQYHDEEMLLLRKGMQKSNSKNFLDEYLMEKQKLMTTEAGTDAVKNDDPLVDNFHQYQACWDIIEG